MIKSYVIDTNILIQAPYACQCFEENRVILPLVVLEELDGLKKAEGEKGANARRAIRFLEKLRMKGDLLKGVELENGGFLRVEANCVGVELPESLPEDKADNRILKVCKGISDEEKPVVLVTKDLVLRIKAQIMGIEAQDFSTEQVIAEEEQYSGRQQCFVAEDKFKDFKKKGVSVKELYLSDEMGNKIQPELVENEFIILKADQSLKKTHLGRVEGKKVVPLKYKKNLPYGVKPRNSGQYFLQEALMKPADEAPLVIVKGMAGTAKTFYSLAVGLEKILNNPTGEYRRILICRPNAQFDSDIGFLPGDEQEKISPLMRPIMDNLEHKIITPYGIPLMPGHLEKTHLARSVWTVYTTGYAVAAAELRKEELLVTLIAQQIRNAVFNKTFYEVYNADDGRAWRWPAQTWNAIGYISLLLSGVFGLKKDIEGIWFEGFIPTVLSGIRIFNLRYVNMCLDVSSEGEGKIVKMTLNGVEVKKIFWNLQGHHKVKLICRKED